MATTLGKKRVIKGAESFFQIFLGFEKLKIMIINSNIAAQSSANALGANQVALSRSLARLSSGSKIVNPSDDAGGLAVSLQLDAKAQRTDAAKSNIANAISFTQVQEGYLKKVGKAFDRMGELAMLAQDVTKSADDLTAYDAEFQKLGVFITTTATKDFNGTSLFSTTALAINTDETGGIFSMAGMNLGTTAAAIALTNIASAANAATALTTVKTETTTLATARANIGVDQLTLSYTSDQLTVSSENLSAASSMIKDVNVATESVAFAKHTMMVQSATSMLAQANQLPQSLMKLLG